MSTDLQTEGNEALGKLEALLEWVRQKARTDKACTDIEKYEEEVIEVVHGVGAELMARELSRHDPVDAEVVVGGVRHTRVVEGTGSYMTVLGPVAVSRGRYRAVRNGATVIPMELEVGIVESFWTPKAAKVAALAVTDLTPGRAEKLFGEMSTLPASKSSFDRLPKALGSRWEAQREHNESVIRASELVPPNAVTVAISFDGVMVAMNDNRRNIRKAESRARGHRDSGPTGHREATVGAIFFYDAEGERIATRRVARMPEKGQATLREQLRTELAHVLQQRPDLRVVAVADGARGVWGFLGKVGADVEVVDFYHAAEHLKDALDKLMGATSRETHQRFEELRHVLLHEPDGVDQVIVTLEELERARKRRGRLSRSARYFRGHRERMRYSSLKAQHLPIGSGVIEGTCKSIVSDRLKRAGMRWSEPGGQAILTLRALSQSDRFDRGWDLLRATYVDDVTACADAAA